MTHRVSGPFDVKLRPLDDDKSGGVSFNRRSLDKQFHGDLEATSKGEMLSAISDVKGSAGYVAIERVTGKLRGRSGTFVLQHHGLMDRGVQTLTITVIPDTAGGKLTGLTGSMTIRIEESKHFYDFDYSLPDP